MTAPTAGYFDNMSTEYNDDRFVRFESIFNFRDLGGLSTRDGAKVRSGLVYRSDQFGNASSADIDRVVDGLGLRTVVDLRTPSEIAATASFPDDRGVNVHNLALSHLNWGKFSYRVESGKSPVPFLTQRYTAMAETGAEAIRDTLDLICTATPMVFHCMAGKDRTGIIAGVTLGLLGVSHADIAADYALTAGGLARYYAWREAAGLSTDEHPMLPEAEAMLGFLTNLESYFGSIEEYAQLIGFTRIDTLREHLLG